MNFTPITVSKVVKKMFPNFVWSIDSEEKTLYLTFDDGPTPEVTEWVLACLKRYNAKATFFCIGKNIEQHPSLFKQIIKDGHGIGNHTNNHLKGWKTSVDSYLKDVSQAQNIINEQHQESEIRNQNLFRPPYGRIKARQSKLLIKQNFKIVMWSVLSLDWDKNVSEQKCYENVVKNAVSGDIVVFHDSIKAFKNMQFTLPKVLDYFSEKGYDFKRIPE
ncbi:MAG: polysaccharide deacetylase family protein [Flavobacteriaceae bacterium]|nr:polysaccharide deacetylase family protein [Flavobacteriaceae bacterium]